MDPNWTVKHLLECTGRNGESIRDFLPMRILLRGCLDNAGEVLPCAEDVSGTSNEVHVSYRSIPSHVQTPFPRGQGGPDA